MLSRRLQGWEALWSYGLEIGEKDYAARSDQFVRLDEKVYHL